MSGNYFLHFGTGTGKPKKLPSVRDGNVKFKPPFLVFGREIRNPNIIPGKQEVNVNLKVL